MIITFLICRYFLFNKKEKHPTLKLNPLVYLKGKAGFRIFK